MIIRDKNGNERIAMATDFQDVTVTFTPSEWEYELELDDRPAAKEDLEELIRTGIRAGSRTMEEI